MKERAEAPTEVSETDLEHPAPGAPGNTDVDTFSTRRETQEALQGTDAEEHTPYKKRELNTDDDR